VKCLACVAGSTLEEYCAEHDATHAADCREALHPTEAPATTTTTGTAGLSLFCFSLMLPWGYEFGLLSSQLSGKKSIFACDEAAVYSSGVLDLGGVQTVKVDSDLHCKYGGEFHTVLNTPVFKKVWERVIQDGRFRLHDWIVKVDPDAVFFPWRLRRVLTGPDQFTAAAGNGTFLNNCGFGLHGPLEVLSRRALEVYAEGVDDCPQPPQEDVYLQQCLIHLGVVQVNHFNLLAEAHCAFEDWEKCDSDHVSFHPFKKWSAYKRCLSKVEAARE